MDRCVLVGELSRHLYVYVDSAFTHRDPAGFNLAVWFGLVSYPGRVWGCTVMLDSGAIYRNLPPHALAFRPNPAVKWKVSEAQTWDCYGDAFVVREYRYLAGLRCLAKAGKRQIRGEYLFSAAPEFDGFSATPEQAKEFSFLKLDNGRLTIQPTDRVVFEERSFTGEGLEFPKGLKRQTEVWSCET